MLLISFLPSWYYHWIPSVLTILCGKCTPFCTWKEPLDTVTSARLLHRISPAVCRKGIEPVSSVLHTFVITKKNLYAITTVIAQRYSTVTTNCAPSVLSSLLQKAQNTIFDCLDNQGQCRIYINSSTWHHIFIILATF